MSDIMETGAISGIVETVGKAINAVLFNGTKAVSEAAIRATIEYLDRPFCVLFLDGRNEHGSHVIPSFPRSIDLEEDDVSEQAEAILLEAESLGFVIGEDHVWAEFTWIEPQIGEFGRVELAGYWDFDRINVEFSRVMSEQARRSQALDELGELDGALLSELDHSKAPEVTR